MSPTKAMKYLIGLRGASFTNEVLELYDGLDRVTIENLPVSVDNSF